MSRTIDDKRANQKGRLDGQAIFTSWDTRLVCEESGILSFGLEKFPAFRRSLWLFPEQNSVEICFDDGRFFHGFSSIMPKAEHLCGADIYQVVYVFAGHEWQSHWAVKGPHKNYEMTTHYTRAA
ncbi:MAG: DUF6314 family protein [Pseudomonadota bacterium]